MKNQLITLISSLGIIPVFSNAEPVRWDVAFESEIGTLKIQTLPNQFYDLSESEDLVTWNRPQGWPRSSDGGELSHSFNKANAGFFNITSYSKGFIFAPEVLSYVNNVPQIPTKKLFALSEFLTGLESLSLKEHFVDGANYRADFQNSQNSESIVAQSIKGSSNLTLVGGPTFGKNGLHFSGNGQYAFGSIPQKNGARTLIGFQTGALSNLSNQDIPIIQLRNAHGAAFNINQSGINGQVNQYSGSGTVRSIMASGWNRITPHMVAVVAKDDGLESPTSYQHRAYPAGNLFPGNIGQTHGTTFFTLDEMRLCVSANHNFSSIGGTAERLIGGWLLFENKLTEEQSRSVIDLSYRTLFPKYRWIWEGDSITNDIQTRYADKGEFRGGNREHINRWTGGQTSTQGVSQLGIGGYVLPWNETQTNLGICDEIATDQYPVFCWIGFGANDLALSTVPVQKIIENMRTMATYAKQRNMIVIVPTVTKGSGIVDNARDSDRRSLNNFIKEDEGKFFDYIVDVDEKFKELAGEDYHLNQTYFRDKIHYTLNTGGGADIAATLLEEKIKNILP